MPESRERRTKAGRTSPVAFYGESPYDLAAYEADPIYYLVTYDQPVGDELLLVNVPDVEWYGIAAEDTTPYYVTFYDDALQ